MNKGSEKLQIKLTDYEDLKLIKYLDHNQTIIVLDGLLNRTLNGLLRLKSFTFSDNIFLEFYTESHEPIEISFKGDLATIFGLNQSDSTISNNKSFKASSNFDIQRHLRTAYIYTDIIKPRIVGSFLSSLLRIVPIKQDLNLITLEKVHYFPVSTTNIHRIRIILTDRNGKVISFNSKSQVLVTLHFRLKR